MGWQKEYVITDFYTFYRVVVQVDIGDEILSVTLDEGFGRNVLTYSLYRDYSEGVYVTLPTGAYMPIDTTEYVVREVLDLIESVLKKSVVIAEREVVLR